VTALGSRHAIHPPPIRIYPLKQLLQVVSPETHDKHIGLLHFMATPATTAYPVLGVEQIILFDTVIVQTRHPGSHATL
jgi:hypothetical protein